MNTFLSRVNNVFAFTLTVLAVLTFGCFLSTVFKNYNRHVDLEAVKMLVKHVKDFSVSRDANDLGIVNVNLKAVLVSLKGSPLAHLLEHIRNYGKLSFFTAFYCNTYKEMSNLCDLFDWNTKQLFVYLTAEYTSKNYAINQVVLWDKIIQRGDKAILNYQNMNSEYYFFDEGDGLRGNKNVTLYLSWNVIPNAGLLPRIFADDTTHTFAFPDDYTPNRI